MGVLQDFERRLEGAVEGFFARAFRSGLQPIELAKAIRRYAEDNQHVIPDGVIVPNVYRFRLGAKDRERLRSYGDSLPRELADVVARTAKERGWELRGPVLVRIEESEDVAYGRYELAGRVEVVEGTVEDGPDAATASPDDATADPEPAAAPPAIALRVRAGDGHEPVRLSGPRTLVGRLDRCDVVLGDPTVSREHAALTRRGSQWWIVDLGSTNGTRVNGSAVSEQQVGPGDRIELGDAELDIVEA